MRGTASLPSFSAASAAPLLGVSVATVQRRCQRGEIGAERVLGNGGEQYSISLANLPLAAQIRYLADQARRLPLDERRDYIRSLNLSEEQERGLAKSLGIARRPRALLQVPLTPDESAAASDAFLALPSSAREEAMRRLAIVKEVEALACTITSAVDRRRMVGESTGESVRSIERWQQAVRGLDRVDWLPALAPKWGNGGRPEADLSSDAWQFILSEWATQSQPALKPIYRRAMKEAERRGWVLPSYQTVKRRIEAQPATFVTFWRKGDQALADMYPSVQRDYSSLKLHEIWCADGRKADVHCLWPDGYVGRPIIVGWEELRSRTILGWHVGKVESADLVRLSFRDAASRANALPREALLDNGRGFAGKLMSGGQPTRYRFKIREDDIPGILTELQVNVIWSTPGHGQSKPIESFWNRISQTDRRAEFAGAYCGNRPDAKPEEFDITKAVPIDRYLAAVREDIEAYNETEHRGDSMNGQTPNTVYADLARVTIIRQPSAKQLHLCLLAAEKVSRDKTGAVLLLGNRYWTEKLAAVPHSRKLIARFNPDDAAEPIAVYDGDRFICEAPIVAKSGFRSQQAAKDKAREASRFKKNQKKLAQALRGMSDAENWSTPPAPDAGGGLQPLPTAKIATPVRPLVAHRLDHDPQQAATEAAELAEYRRRREAALADFTEEEGLPRLASGR